MKKFIVITTIGTLFCISFANALTQTTMPSHEARELRKAVTDYKNDRSRDQAEKIINKYYSKYPHDQLARAKMSEKSRIDIAAGIESHPAMITQIEQPQAPAQESKSERESNLIEAQQKAAETRTEITRDPNTKAPQERVAQRRVDGEISTKEQIHRHVAEAKTHKTENILERKTTDQ